MPTSTAKAPVDSFALYINEYYTTSYSLDQQTCLRIFQASHANQPGQHLYRYVQNVPNLIKPNPRISLQSIRVAIVCNDKRTHKFSRNQSSNKSEFGFSLIFCKKALELVHIISKWKPGIICILAIKLIYPDYKSDMLSTDYNPFQWPPNLQLAKLHYDASKSGTDKPDGQRCPCCNRQEKQPNNTWFMRNIREDFKRYGGGIPGFFYLLLYVLTVMFILGVFNVIYHIMLLDEVCPTLEGTSDSCALVFGVFYFCEHDVLSDTLQGNGQYEKATILEYLQLATYIFLVLTTLGIKVFLYAISKKTDLDEKLFSHFALLVKNVPLYYQLEDLEAELKIIDPEVEVVEMFYLHKACQYENTVRKLVDLYFLMNNADQNMRIHDPGRYEKEYKKMKEKYLQLYELYEKEALNLKSHSKKVIVVFNTIKQKQNIHAALSLNKLSKFLYYFFKMLGCKRESVGYFTERVAEPQEIYWKYIGESSTQKEKVRIETAFVCAAVVALVYGVMYFPMLIIDKQKILNPGMGTGLGIMVSVIVVTLFLVIRSVIGSIMPLRKPSNKLAEGYFIVVTIAVFFFAFYIVSPAIFYFFADDFSKNTKLGTFFLAILVFCISTLTVNLVDVGYRIFQQRKNTLLDNPNEANKYCQGRLHEQVTPPAFPIPFYLVVVFNVWSFNSYYIFQMPHLLPLFFLVVFFMYWITKYTLYNHYRTQSYLSLELEDKTQKIVLVIFLICVSLGYLAVTEYAWQRYLIIGVFVTAISLNFLLEHLLNQKKDENIVYNTDLKAAMQKCIQDPKATNILNILEADLKASFVFTDPEDLTLEISAASLVTTIGLCGYQETYNLYLNQFQKREINQLLEDRHQSIKATHLNMPLRRQSQLAKLFGKPLQQVLLQSGVPTKNKKISSRNNNKNSQQMHRANQQYEKIIQKSFEQSLKRSQEKQLASLCREDQLQSGNERKIE